jgi:two-component system NtrC family sensor kinase
LKPSVLIVDDSLTVRMDLGEAFELTGFATTLCSTVAEARSALSTGSFSLIILDVLLPDGDGIDLLREIRQTPANAGALVMLLSSEAEVSDRTRGLKTGADEYVGKPYDQSYVVARALVRTPAKTRTGRQCREIDDRLDHRR